MELARLDIRAEIVRIESRQERTSKDEKRLLELRLYSFFMYARDQKWLTSLDWRPGTRKRHANPPIILEQIRSEALEQPGYENFSLLAFVGFSTNNVHKAYMSARNCHVVKSVFPRTAVYQDPEYAEIRNAWNELVGPSPNWTPHFLKRMTREGEPPTNFDNSKLKGDYLMFRIDDPGHVRPAFFRFYPHHLGERIRSMGLRLDDRFGRLSSKGWVLKQNYGYMVAGYIVTRDHGGAVPDGGFSLMNVSDDVQNRLVVARRGEIEMAPVLHMQSTFASGGTASRGLLIRLHGAEKEGGQREQTKEERHLATLDFHQDLIDRFGSKLSLSEVSQIIEKVTGINRYHFAFTRQMRPPDFPWKLARDMHTGAFLNIPNS